MRKAAFACFVAILLGIAFGLWVSKNFDITDFPVAPPIQSISELK